jgi:hypothetical protein
VTAHREKRQPKFARPDLGYFRTTEPEDFARAVAGMTGAWVVVEGDVVQMERCR